MNILYLITTFFILSTSAFTIDYEGEDPKWIKEDGYTQLMEYIPLLTFIAYMLYFGYIFYKNGPGSRISAPAIYRFLVWLGTPIIWGLSSIVCFFLSLYNQAFYLSLYTLIALVYFTLPYAFIGQFNKDFFYPFYFIISCITAYFGYVSLSF